MATRAPPGSALLALAGILAACSGSEASSDPPPARGGGTQSGKGGKAGSSAAGQGGAIAAGQGGASGAPVAGAAGAGGSVAGSGTGGGGTTSTGGSSTTAGTGGVSPIAGAGGVPSTAGNAGASAAGNGGASAAGNSGASAAGNSGASAAGSAGSPSSAGSAGSAGAPASSVCVFDATGPTNVFDTCTFAELAPMDFNIRFSVDAPRGFQRRLLMYVVTPLALVAATAAISRATLDPAPSTWAVAGKPVSAAALAKNLTDLDARLKAAEAKIVGTTDTAVAGDLGGYNGARALCATKFGPTAHMCTSQEVLRTVSLPGAMPVPQGWYGTGVRSVSSSNVVNDCVGFTSSESFFSGPTWTDGKAPHFELCSSKRPVLCCDLGRSGLPEPEKEEPGPSPSSLDREDAMLDRLLSAFHLRPSRMQSVSRRRLVSPRPLSMHAVAYRVH